MRLTESHLRKLIREEVAKISRRPTRRLVEALSLSDQIDDAIAMSDFSEVVLNRIRRQLSDGIDDEQLARTLCAMLEASGNVGRELRSICAAAKSGDMTAMSQLFDAARNSAEFGAVY